MADQDVVNVLEKADLAIADFISSGDGWNGGGALNPAQSDSFLEMMLNTPTIMPQVRVEPMNTPVKKIDKIGFGSRILRRATFQTPLAAAKRAKPSLGQVTLTTSEHIALVYLGYETLEDQISRGKLPGTIMRLIAERVSLDMEELLILGNTGSADDDLKAFNGIIAYTPGHIVNVAGDIYPNINPDKFKKATLAMPSKYLRDPAAFRYFVNNENVIEYRDWAARNRMTVAGDSARTDAAPIAYGGTPVQMASLMPTTNILFTHPKNLIWGVQRQITIETDRDIEARVLLIVLTMRVAFAIEETDACVLVTGIDNTFIPEHEA